MNEIRFSHSEQETNEFMKNLRKIKYREVQYGNCDLFAEDACLERDDNQTAIDELQAENAELKFENNRLKCELDLRRDGNIIREETLNEIESLKASHYAEMVDVLTKMVDARMRESKLRRALWIARAERAKAMYTYWHVKCIEGHLLYEHKWIVVERLCMAKAEEYK